MTRNPLFDGRVGPPLVGVTVFVVTEFNRDRVPDVVLDALTDESVIFQGDLAYMHKDLWDRVRDQLMDVAVIADARVIPGKEV